MARLALSALLFASVAADGTQGAGQQGGFDYQQYAGKYMSQGGSQGGGGQKSGGQGGFDYSKYMGGGAQGGQKSAAQPANAASTAGQAGGSGDKGGQGGKGGFDYSKYMGGGAQGGQKSAAQPAAKGAQGAQGGQGGGDYSKYYSQYMKQGGQGAKGGQDAKGGQGAQGGQGGGDYSKYYSQYMKSNKSDYAKEYEHYYKQYQGQGNQSHPNGNITGTKEMKQYASGNVPAGVTNVSNRTQWKEAFAKKYADQYKSQYAHADDKSDAEAKSKATVVESPPKESKEAPVVESPPEEAKEAQVVESPVEETKQLRGASEEKVQASTQGDSASKVEEKKKEFTPFDLAAERAQLSAPAESHPVVLLVAAAVVPALGVMAVLTLMRPRSEAVEEADGGYAHLAC